MQVYPKRIWKGVIPHMLIQDENKLVDVTEMDDKEFRQFVIWRLGFGMMPSESAKAPPRQRVREYDIRRTKPRARR